MVWVFTGLSSERDKTLPVFYSRPITFLTNQQRGYTRVAVFAQSWSLLQGTRCRFYKIGLIYSQIYITSFDKIQCEHDQHATLQDTKLICFLFYHYQSIVFKSVFACMLLMTLNMVNYYDACNIGHRGVLGFTSNTWNLKIYILVLLKLVWEWIFSRGCMGNLFFSYTNRSTELKLKSTVKIHVTRVTQNTIVPVGRPRPYSIIKLNLHTKRHIKSKFPNHTWATSMRK